MATEHRDIPDAERHEPKGISTAQIGQVYRSNGLASGSWSNDLVEFSAVISDISTASFVLIPITVDCTILSIKVVLHDAITDDNPTLTITRGGDGASITAILIPFTGSAEGTTVTATAFTQSNLNANDHNYVKIATNGLSTTISPVYISIKAKVVE